MPLVRKSEVKAGKFVYAHALDRGTRLQMTERLKQRQTFRQAGFNDIKRKKATKLGLRPAQRDYRAGYPLPGTVQEQASAGAQRVNAEVGTRTQRRLTESQMRSLKPTQFKYKWRQGLANTYREQGRARHERKTGGWPGARPLGRDFMSRPTG